MLNVRRAVIKLLGKIKICWRIINGNLSCQNQNMREALGKLIELIEKIFVRLSPNPREYLTEMRKKNSLRQKCSWHTERGSRREAHTEREWNQNHPLAFQRCNIISLHIQIINFRSIAFMQNVVFSEQYAIKEVKRQPHFSTAEKKKLFGWNIIFETDLETHSSTHKKIRIFQMWKFFFRKNIKNV